MKNIDYQLKSDVDQRRDDIALEALKAILQSGINLKCDQFAAAAYGIADAMLAAKHRKSTKDNE